MILQTLFTHYEALAKKGEIARSGWEKVKVSFALEIDKEGSLTAIHPLKTLSEDGKRMQPRVITLPARVKKNVGISSNFLCENAAYFLGIGELKDPERLQKCFDDAKQLHHQILSQVDLPCARAILLFFNRFEPSKSKDNFMLLPYLNEFEAGANLVFMYDGNYPHDESIIGDAWQTYYDGEQEGTPMTCLVTGKMLVPESTHPSVKGIPGAQSAGAALVSFNAPAYCSYNREQNLNAPVSKYAAFAYTTALNHLIADREHRKLIGDSTIVYWAQEADHVYQDAFSFFLEGDQDLVTDKDLDTLMHAVAHGKVINWDGIPLNPVNRFYVLGIAPNAARLSVRFFLEDSFGSMVKNLKAHYDRLEIIPDNRNKFKHIPLWALLRETVNEKATDKTPSHQMAGDTLRAILTGGRYPATLYQQMQIRIRADRKVNQERAAIIKAYLLRNTDNNNYQEVLKVELNDQSTYQPYVLGRLFALLEEVQNRASNVSTIKDKYFTSACATPAVVFPMIVNLSDKHMKKLDDRAKIYYAKQIGELMTMVTQSYPAHHNLSDQGIFQLGYYHQSQKRYQKKDTTQTTKEDE